MALTQWERDHKRKTHRKKRLYVWLFFLGLAGGGIGYMLFFSGQFEVRTVSVSGLEALSQESIQNSVELFFASNSNKFIFRFIAPKNLILVSTDMLAEYLSREYTLLAAVSVQKKTPDGLVIVIEERDPIFIICKKETDECFYIDEKGIAYERAPHTEGSLITIIETEAVIEQGKNILNPHLIRDLKLFRDLLQDRLNLTTQKIVIGKLAVSFELFAGWSVRVEIGRAHV